MTPAQFRDLVSLPPVVSSTLTHLGILRCKILVMRGPGAPDNMRQVGDALWACLDEVEMEIQEVVADAKAEAEEAVQEADNRVKENIKANLEALPLDIMEGCYSNKELERLRDLLAQAIAATPPEEAKAS